jgi:large subunit ribosomal protein L15
VVDLAALEGAGLAKGKSDGLVVLGTSELKSAYTVKADRVTAGARAAIEKAGGKVELLPKPQTMYEKARAAKKAATPEQSAERAAKKAAQAAEKAAKAAAKAEKLPKAEKKDKAEKAEKAEKKDK